MAAKAGGHGQCLSKIGFSLAAPKGRNIISRRCNLRKGTMKSRGGSRTAPTPNSRGVGGIFFVAVPIRRLHLRLMVLGPFGTPTVEAVSDRACPNHDPITG